MLTEEYRQARPWIRSVLAFITYLRFGDEITITNAYEVADEFITTVERDVNADKS